MISGRYKVALEWHSWVGLSSAYGLTYKTGNPLPTYLTRMIRNSYV